MLWCEGDGDAGVVAVSAYMDGTRGSGGCREMSVVRGVGGVCDMCMCLARDGVGGVGGEWVTGLGLGAHQFWWNMGKVGYVSEFWLRWCGCGWCLGESGWAAWARVWEGRVCYICVCCESGFSVLMAGPVICILCQAHLRCTSVQSCYTLSISVF